MQLLIGASLIASVTGIAYLGFAALRLQAFRKRCTSTSPTPTPGVTVLKPLCGLEPQLYENLSSFCDQDYPDFQVIFGVRDSADPAAGVANQVIERLAQRDVQLVVDPRVRGENLKIANVRNMFEHAKHDLVLIADSDTRVDPGYIRSVVAQFSNPRVGAVTCLYRGVALQGIAQELGALFINDQFIPSVLVASTLGPIDFCLGATMAVTRKALESIGGFEALSPHLADDRMLGKCVYDRGFDVALSDYVVEVLVNESDIPSLWEHELRWARAIFSARPAGYAFSFVTYALPLSLLYWLLSQDLLAGALLTGAAGALRLIVHSGARKTLHVRSADRPWLIPLRDVLGLAVWAASFFTRGVRWRNQDYAVDAAGRMVKQR